MFNKDIFFENFRPFYKAKTGKNKLSATTVKSVDFLLDSFDGHPKWKNVKHVAYALATIAHETAWTFAPIKEFRGTTLTSAQKKYWPTGYYGRGYVQLTWLANYRKAGDKLGIDLVRHPDLALKPEVAFKILTSGMHEGWFTGKKLSDYITNTKADYVNARRIINGTDRANLIASYARAFEAMLTDALEYSNPLVKRTGDSQPVENDGEPTEETNVEEVDVTGDEVVTPEDSTDGYPNEPKPGEATPDKPAEKGEPVVGGRPIDPPVVVPAVEPKETSGWGVWLGNLRAQYASLGLGTISLGSLTFITNPLFIKIALGALATAIVVSVTVYITSIVLKHREKMQREMWAHQETLKQLEINADPTKYNVQLVKPVEDVKPQLSLFGRVRTNRSKE